MVAATRWEISAKLVGKLAGGWAGAGGLAVGPGLVALLAASFSGIQGETTSFCGLNILVPP